MAVSKTPFYCDGHAQKTVQTMSNEDVVVESSNVLFGKGKYMGVPLKL